MSPQAFNPPKAWTTWVCGFCSKLGDSPPMKPGDSAYDATLPFGWAWAKYKSARLPNADSRALGCCVEHAKLAAEKFTAPFDVKDITITKVQE